jgi:2-dehydro-3-deoxy-L-rhamnonate dehydrogenase (NAD+)
MSLSGRVALITGGARGIGLAIARRLSADGARVALVDLDKSAVEAAAGDIGASALALVADVTRADDVERAVGAAHARWGRLDIVVNNAGITGGSKLTWELTDEDWSQVIACDLTSVFLVSRAAVRLMLAHGSGRIVNIASIAGKEGNPMLVPYSTAKAGVIGFTKALAKEVANRGIFVNAVAPAVIGTDMVKQMSKETVDYLVAKIPMGARRTSGGGRGARRLARFRRVLVLDRRRLRSLRRPGDVLKQGQLRDRLGDVALDRHAHSLLERHHPPLDELVLVGGQGIVGQPVGRVAVRDLVQVGVGRVEGRQELEPLGAVAPFLAQLALRRGPGFFAGLGAAPRKLPRDRADEVAILADEQDPTRLDEGEHADRHADREDRVDDLLAVRQPPGIFAEGELAARVERRRRQAGPGRVHRPMIS